MSDVTFPIAGLGSSSAPLDYTVHGDQEFTLLGVRAVFDGSASTGSWVPYIQILSGAGSEMIHSKGDTVLAGGSADVSFFPRVRRTTAAPFSFTYAQVIAALKAAYTCVAEWRLTDGGPTYADTSGFSVADPATLHIQPLVVPMTQALADGPLHDFPAGPSVRFNFDGDATISSGEYLFDTVATPGRYAFLGNLPFSVVAWVKPLVPARTHYGPVVTSVKEVGGGGPGTTWDGWQINVSAPTNECRLERWCGVGPAGTPEFASLGVMSSTNWTMVVMTYDGASIRGYANGALVTTVASPGVIGNGTNIQLGEFPAPPLVVGNWYYGASSQVSIWANTFTSDDVASLYAAGIS